ncbi:MAG: hypothetical protein J6O49_18350 [Bacteroidaceae bacterium]|nr:hypothetical protein [Bacteroidaceae bacterium]
MLYGLFAFFMILLSIMGIIHMCVLGSYTYLIFPISTLVWGFYKFFHENDEEYCRRNGVDPSLDIGWLFGLGDDETSYGGYNRYGQYGDHHRPNETTISTRHRTSSPTVRFYSDPEYKKILPRCRRNSMVTTEKIKTKQEEQ